MRFISKNERSARRPISDVSSDSKKETSSTPSIILAAAGAQAIKMADAALDKSAEKIGFYLSDKTSDVRDNIVSNFRIGFQTFIQSSYERCRTYKTLLNPYNPIPVLDNYIHTNVEISGKHYNDDTLIKGIRPGSRIIVSGLAGGGKSMLMKYITLQISNQKLGLLPLFIELRRFNSEPSTSLEQLIIEAMRIDASKVTPEQFSLGLQAGTFALILDGFDELKEETAQWIEREIIKFEGFHPKTAIIVSSRPSHRFESWERFYHTRVLPLTKRQAIELINSFVYEDGVKTRFLERVKSDLWNSHESFLSSPLLCTIMMLTFEEFAEIPTKMHAFYSQAFDTLFQRHDALKSQFNRETKTGLTRDIFRRCISSFCLTSYLEQKYTMSDEVAIKHSESAVRYVRQSTNLQLKGVTGENLVSDLIDCVNVLQPDGLDLTFVHRSFQEYFAALFAVNYHDNKFPDLLDRFSQRFTDSALLMAFDMAREKVETEWVIPRLKEKIDQVVSLQQLNQRVKLIYTTLYFVKNPKNHLYVYSDFESRNFGFVYALSKLYPRQLSSHIWLNPIEKLIPQDLLRGLMIAGSSEADEDFDNWLKSPQDKEQRTRFVVDLDQDNSFLVRLGFDQTMDSFITNGPKVLKSIHQRQKSRTSVMNDFLNID